MTVWTVTAKGQVMLGKDLLEHLGVQPGDKVMLDKHPNGRIEIRAARPAGKISDVFDILKRRTTSSLSVDEINQIGRAIPAQSQLPSLQMRMPYED